MSLHSMTVTHQPPQGLRTRLPRNADELAAIDDALGHHAGPDRDGDLSSLRRKAAAQGRRLRRLAEVNIAWPRTRHAYLAAVATGRLLLQAEQVLARTGQPHPPCGTCTCGPDRDTTAANLQMRIDANRRLLVDHHHYSGHDDSVNDRQREAAANRERYQARRLRVGGYLHLHLASQARHLARIAAAAGDELEVARLRRLVADLAAGRVAPTKARSLADDYRGRLRQHHREQGHTACLPE